MGDAADDEIIAEELATDFGLKPDERFAPVQAASVFSERKQLSEGARALNGNRHGQYRENIVKRVQSLIAERDSLDAERNRLRAEDEQLKHQRDTLAEAVGALSKRENQ